MRLLALALLLAACSPTETPARCTPNTTIPCTCAGGASSSQVCAADGAGYGTCACELADAGGDVVALDAAVVPDVAGDLVEVMIWIDPPRDAAVDVVDVSLEDRPDVQLLDTPAADLGAEVGACGADATTCDAGCRDLTTDPTNCGACGNVCHTAGAPHTRGVCFASACTTSCEEGWRNCDRNDANGCEVHSAVDRMNCGTCGTICPPTEQCVMGICRRP